MNPSKRVWLRGAAAAGMFAPLLFGAALLSLTLTENAFLRSLGWNPLAFPTLDWPSGLEIGPYGAWMEVTFVLSGLLTVWFGWGLRHAWRTQALGRWAGILVMVAGVALLALASPPDPTLTTLQPSWHDILHDLSYVVLGLSLFPAMLLFGFAFHTRSAWRNLSIYTWATAGLAAPAFALKHIAVYLYLAGVIAWTVVVAWRLWKTV